MDDELETLLRDRYRRGADGIHAGPDLVRRYQRAGRDVAGPARPGWRARVRHWTLPLVAGAVTAAVVAAVAVLLLPGAGRSDPPRPMAPPSPAGTSPPWPTPSAPPSSAPTSPEPTPTPPTSTVPTPSVPTTSVPTTMPTPTAPTSSVPTVPTASTPTGNRTALPSTTSAPQG